jgi:hypothetical protein
MNFSKETDSFCAETEPGKESVAYTLNSPRLKMSSAETSPYKSFYSAFTPVNDFSHRFADTEDVFDRLVLDTNRRYGNKEKLRLFIRQKENQEIRKFSEKEEVYQRLFADTQQRVEQKHLKEKFREQETENTIKSFRSAKTCTKQEAEAVVRRLLSKKNLDSPRKIIEQEYQFNKQRDLTRFCSFDSLKIKEKTSPVKVLPESQKNAVFTKSGKNREKTRLEKKIVSPRDENLKGQNMDIVERTEIEQRYGKPGKPADPEAGRKFHANRKEKKRVGFV